MCWRDTRITGIGIKWRVWHDDASNISDGRPVARLKDIDRSLPNSCEGRHQLVPWIDLYSLNVLLSDQAIPEFTFCVAINYAYIYTQMYANAREWERSERGYKRRVRLERDTPHGRVKPTCLPRKNRSAQRFAPSKTDFEKKYDRFAV